MCESIWDKVCGYICTAVCCIVSHRIEQVAFQSVRAKFSTFKSYLHGVCVQKWSHQLTYARRVDQCRLMPLLIHWLYNTFDLYGHICRSMCARAQIYETNSFSPTIILFEQQICALCFFENFVKTFIIFPIVQWESGKESELIHSIRKQGLHYIRCLALNCVKNDFCLNCYQLIR